MSASLRATLAVATLIAFAGGCLPEGASRGWECIAPANAGGGWDRTCRSVAQVLGALEMTPGAMRTTNMPGAGGGVAFAHTVSQRDADPRVLVAAPHRPVSPSAGRGPHRRSYRQGVGCGRGVGHMARTLRPREHQ